MATIKRFEDLEVWQLAREQSQKIWGLTRQENFSKDFSLKNQIIASAGSVMDNIAEGFERFSKKEFIQFLVIAKGSNGEVRSQLYRSFDQNYFSKEVLEERLNFSVIIGNKISSFINYLYSSEYKTKPITPPASKPPTSNIEPPTALNEN